MPPPEPAVAFAPGADAAAPAPELPPLPSASSLPASPPAASRRVGNLDDVGQLSRFFAALGALEGGRSHDDVRIVQYGDSHTASDTGTSVVRRMLQERFGDGGRGFVELGKPWKTYVQDGVHGGMTSEFEPNRTRVEDGRVVGDGAYGLVGVAIETERRGARAWTKIAAPASRVEVDFLQQPRGGSVDVVIDGVQAGRIATRAPLATSGFAGFDLADTPHEVELRAVGDGDVRLFGLALDRPSPGVVVDALGINGAQITTPLRWNEGHFDEQLRHRAPDLVILAYGTNEALDPKLDLVAYERALVDLLGRVARAVPTASCLLLGPPDLARRDPPEHREWATWPPVFDVVAVQRRVARAAGCAYYDQIAAMGGPGSIAAWAAEVPPRAQADRVHLTLAGYAQVGAAFATDLVHAYDGWRSGQSQSAH
jgi:lysophospholipase L1-like esterase